jgi:hydrogenase maturation protease
MNNPNDGARGENFGTIKGTIKIIGIGQSLRGDDAAGLAAVRLWQETYQVMRPNVHVEFAELPGIGLLSLLEGASVAILVDAVHSGSRAGIVHVLTENQLETFTDGAGSAHGWGVAETLSLGRKLMPSALPEQLILIGIEAGQLDLGEALSLEVESALPEAARLIEHYVSIDRLHHQSHSASPCISPT